VTGVERQAAACLMPSFPGHVVPEWVERWLERGLGGITLFAYNVSDPEQLAELTRALRAEQPELLISIDEEGGDVTRLEASRGSSYPGNLALGTIDDPALTEEVASAIAGDLARAGVNLNLAPVADTNTNPRNPVIGVRSFGSDPELVARHVAAFVAGTQRQGVAACAKHFPGHGDTTADSHRELPVVGGDLSAALLPFRAAVAADVWAVMTGHLLLPALDDVPATISEPILTGLLRGELGFEGVVLTDALEMRAISRSVGVTEGAVLALAAGADALCLGHDLHEDAVEQVHAAIVRAVRAGRLGEERLAAAAARVEALGNRVSPTDAGAADRTVGAEAARRAIEISGEVSVGAPILVLELAAEANVAAGEAKHGLADLLSDAITVRLHDPPLDLAALLAQHDNRRLVLVARDASRHAWQQATIAQVMTLRPDVVVLETGLPGFTTEGVASMVTNGAGRANLAAAAQSLVGNGDVGATGRFAR
jgi:beta-N-acetylhexosaminidase